MKISFLFLLLFSCSVNAQNKTISLSGENFISITGGKFINKKVVFTSAEGDWFATTTDAHGALTFYAPYDSRQIRLDMEWDGKNEDHIITNEVRHNGKHTGDFIMTLPDKNVFGDGLNAYPDENNGINEAIKITVMSMDEMNVQAKISGNISNGREHMQVSGMISLKKDIASKTSATASYKDCDNVIHDKMIGAQYRSPTECEVKFDLDLRTALHLSFKPLIDSLLKNGWRLEKETQVKSIMGIGRGSEKNFYDPGLTDVGNYALHFQLNPASPEYKNWQTQYADMMNDFQKDPTKPGSMDKLTAFTAEMKVATDISIYVNVNYSATAAVNFTTSHHVEKTPNTTCVVYLKNAQAATGGGKEESGNAAWVYFGKWSSPKFQKNSDGSERVELNATPDPKASHLSVQTIVIRMECNDDLSDEVIKYTDFKKLQSLLQ
jgi:hypothetical protein